MCYLRVLFCVFTSKRNWQLCWNLKYTVFIELCSFIWHFISSKKWPKHQGCKVRFLKSKVSLSSMDIVLLMTKTHNHLSMEKKAIKHTLKIIKGQRFIWGFALFSLISWLFLLFFNFNRCQWKSKVNEQSSISTLCISDFFTTVRLFNNHILLYRFLLSMILFYNEWYCKGGTNAFLSEVWSHHTSADHRKTIIINSNSSTKHFFSNNKALFF